MSRRNRKARKPPDNQQGDAVIGQMCLPLSLPSLSLTSDLHHMEQAMRRAPLRRPRHPSNPVAAAVQLVIDFSQKWKHRSRGTRRPAKFPFEVVEYARKLRGFGFLYREISEEINHKFKVKVHFMTVRDWTCLYYRCSK